MIPLQLFPVCPHVCGSISERLVPLNPCGCSVYRQGYIKVFLGQIIQRVREAGFFKCFPANSVYTITLERKMDISLFYNSLYIMTFFFLVCCIEAILLWKHVSETRPLLITVCDFAAPIIVTLQQSG